MLDSNTVSSVILKSVFFILWWFPILHPKLHSACPVDASFLFVWVPRYFILNSDDISWKIIYDITSYLKYEAFIRLCHEIQYDTETVSLSDELHFHFTGQSYKCHQLWIKQLSAQKTGTLETSSDTQFTFGETRHSIYIYFSTPCR